ncbi:hypothetical protein [Zymobacter sp. IVIA_5232.4 C2]|uniref:hypothetical protein n=1 Tax=Zymobacter sp. IVIA_5232.4 C2 TaxID=3394855 RepID=UPI0039C4A1F7
MLGKKFSKIVKIYPSKNMEGCREIIDIFTDTFVENNIYPGFEKILSEAFRICVATCGQTYLTIDRPAGVFYSELRRYTMTLTIGDYHSPKPSYIVFSKRKSNEEKKLAQIIGGIFLLSEYFKTLFNEESNRLEFNNLTLRSIDHSFICAHLMEYSSQSSDLFTTEHDIEVNFNDIDQEKVLIIFHCIDIKKVRFFLPGGEERVVSYSKESEEKDQPLFLFMKQWQKELKRYMEYPSSPLR